jgi:hypothetical protein
LLIILGELAASHISEKEIVPYGDILHLELIYKFMVTAEKPIVYYSSEKNARKFGSQIVTS